LIKEQEEENEYVHQVKNEISRFKSNTRTEVEDYKNDRAENLKNLEKKVATIRFDVLEFMSKLINKILVNIFHTKIVFIIIDIIKLIRINLFNC